MRDLLKAIEASQRKADRLKLRKRLEAAKRKESRLNAQTPKAAESKAGD